MQYSIPPTVYATEVMQGISWKTCAPRTIAKGCPGKLLAGKVENGQQMHLVRFRGVTCPMEVKDNQISKELI